ncbi:hypothetical protein PMKS-001040 [Pichia membranifaciens]|uniref:Uncharacterized protein n=1 Tax=Pichia membranifaciens TaxID=4926 RepID=A0A1Q2YDG6_9ASCO|nr:hypothetical protein PMKS-001040 [Pichia membranifaciens]
MLGLPDGSSGPGRGFSHYVAPADGVACGVAGAAGEPEAASEDEDPDGEERWQQQEEETCQQGRPVDSAGRKTAAVQG